LLLQDITVIIIKMTVVQKVDFIFDNLI